MSAAAEAPRPAGRVALRFDDVGFSYGDIRVLEGASFHIHEGEFATLCGPNGSGKTTILKLLLGIVRPGSGRVTVFGREAGEARLEVGYVPQAVVYDPAFPVSVAEVVRMGRLRGSFGLYHPEDAAAARIAMEETGIADLADRPYAALSGGQRRRVLVARALASEPRLLVLDEPTSNMDAASEAQLFRSLGALKGRTTILVVTHDPDFVSALTDVALCVGGREGRPGAVRRHPALPAGPGPVPATFGGEALRVAHEAELPSDGCFGEEATR